MTKKRFWRLAIVVVLGAGIGIGILYGRIIAEKVPDAEEIKESMRLLSQAEYEGYQEPSGLPGVEGKVHVFQDDGLTYYVNTGGHIVRIDDKEGINARYPEQKQPAFDREQAVKAAEKLFDDVFEEAEAILGHRKKTEAMDFNGADYLVTIVLMRDDRESGNKASISYAADGRLISGMFIWETYADRSKEITAERARELALEYFYDHYGEITYVSGYRVLDVTVGQASYLVWNGKGYYDVSVTATYSRKEWDGSNLVDPGSIRIKAEDGEFIWHASTLR